MRPFVLLRHVLQSLLVEGRSSPKTLLPNVDGQPEITQHLVKSVRHCLRNYVAEKSEHGRAWLQWTREVLDASIMTFFLLVGSAIEPWKTAQQSSWRDVTNEDLVLRYSSLALPSKDGGNADSDSHSSPEPSFSSRSALSD